MGQEVYKVNEFEKIGIYWVNNLVYVGVDIKIYRENQIGNSRSQKLKDVESL